MQEDAGMRNGTTRHVGAQPLADLQQNVLSGPAKAVRQAQGSHASKSCKLPSSMLRDSVLEVQAFWLILTKLPSCCRSDCKVCYPSCWETYFASGFSTAAAKGKHCNACELHHAACTPVLKLASSLS